MLHLYNLEHVKIKGLKAYKDYCIESTLSTGDKVLSFLYPSYLAKDIIEESYIRTKTAEFVVKEIDDQNQWKSIKAVINVEDLEGKEWEQFDSTEQTITDCLQLAIAGTGWTIGTCNVTRRRTVRKTNCSAWEVIQEAKKRYRVEIEFDTLNKKINIAEKLGTDKGVYFMDSLNLKNLSIQCNSYDFYTRIIAKGKEDLKVTVENFQYSNKIKTLIWKDERYTDEDSLREDATAKLEELSKPYRAYSADILDLANMSEKYKDILEYSLGDTITLISKEKGIREKQRVVTIREYPDEPQRNTCEIANTTLKFEDIQKEYQDTTNTVNNITADDGTISEEAVKNAFTVFNKINANEINVLKGQFGELKVNKLDVDVANIKFTEINKAIINKAD
ncbi:phage tail protein, partial [Clostridium cadaveris]|uniref:phage tail protein n=1 Tax=Clostridium cadaveris TaxID=1529 RepID=UPI0025A471BC